MTDDTSNSYNNSNDINSNTNKESDNFNSNNENENDNQNDIDSLLNDHNNCYFIHNNENIFCHIDIKKGCFESNQFHFCSYDNHFS